MVIFKWTRLRLALLLAGLTTLPTVASAQDTHESGIVQISDRQVSSTVVAPTPVPGAVVGRPVQHHGHAYYSGAYPVYVGHSSPYETAHSPLRPMLTPGGGATYSPGHGWSRPVKYPVIEQTHVYQRLYPNYWAGQAYPPGAHFAPKFPMVYTPTDTTQLGYHHQHVPTWQPNPTMIPRPIWPQGWHYREAPLGVGASVAGSHLGGTVIQNGTVVGNPTPVPQSTVIHSGPVMNAPATPPGGSIIQPVPSNVLAPTPAPQLPAPTQVAPPKPLPSI